MSEILLKDLKIGDKLICFRVLDNTFRFLALKITNIREECLFSVISETSLDTYTFSRGKDTILNGAKIILDNGNTNCSFDFDEYIFENIDDAKKFAVDYYNKKINNYKKAIEEINREI